MFCNGYWCRISKAPFMFLDRYWSHIQDFQALSVGARLFQKRQKWRSRIWGYAKYYVFKIDLGICSSILKHIYVIKGPFLVDLLKVRKMFKNIPEYVRMP